MILEGFILKACAGFKFLDFSGLKKNFAMAVIGGKKEYIKKIIPIKWYNCCKA
jgi:hypothetical protein